MTYNPQSKSFRLSLADLERAADCLKAAIIKIRVMGGLPLAGYKHDGRLETAHHAEIEVLAAARCLGIDFGFADPERLNHGQLDLSDD